jgi:Asp-tRNA(Asn)/Glu-tRNA(Gln) amidotransferase A subunit family amidase
MSFPMKRVNAERYHELTSEEDVAAAQRIILEGFDANYLPAHDRENQPFYPRTITEYHAFYKSGKFLPSQVMLRSMEAVKRWESQGFRIFSSILPDDVMRAARESDARWQAGAPLSMFDGVPVAFKDMMDVQGHTIYEGRNPGPEHALEWVQSEKDDLMVSRLRALGAIVFGVTIEVEGGVSPLGFNAHFQGPVNPYSMNRYSGGSSSGSAVAVATGVVPVAIGYDGGGSIRLPGKREGWCEQYFCWFSSRKRLTTVDLPLATP